MKALRFLFVCVLMLAMMPVIHAATVHGTVYDLSLKKISNAKVEINTVPKQTIIAENGSYSFNVPIGRYILNAYMMQKSNVIASVQENITIRQDGSYVLDLILFPDLEEGVENIDLNVDEIDAGQNVTWLIVLGIVIILSVLIFFYLKNKKSHSAEGHQEKIEKNILEGKHEAPDESLNGIIKIIEKEGGRTTQKEIRKQIPLSEAKISLMIADLEHKGIVEKIKKGRGNIIILKK